MGIDEKDIIDTQVFSDNVTVLLSPKHLQSPASMRITKCDGAEKFTVCFTFVLQKVII